MIRPGERAANLSCLVRDMVGFNLRQAKSVTDDEDLAVLARALDMATLDDDEIGVAVS